MRRSLNLKKCCRQVFHRWVSRGAVPLALMAALIGMGGCHRNTDTGRSVSPKNKQHFVRGKVISVDAKDGVIALDTEKIPGFMDAMTMAYTLQNPSVASELHSGDIITAQLQVGADGAVLSQIDIIQQAVLNSLPPVQYHVPQRGDTVPNFSLLNQSGREIHVNQFRGKVLVLTFIYTRCQSSQYCPLMSRNFAELDRLLAADPKLYAKTHLLSISFDPKYDTPAVLRSYGGAYTGRYTKETFRHWDFAAPSMSELASVLQWFDVGVTSSDGGKVLLHSVSTAVVGPDGTIRNWYPTNTWTPQQLLHDVQQMVPSDGRKSKG